MTNTGYRNTGDCNTGDCNTGNFNTGGWNASNYHVGCFNTLDAEQAYYFNKLGSVSEWRQAKKPDFLFRPYPTTWIASNDMTDAEKAEYPSHETNGGYLRKNDMRQEWQKAWSTADAKQVALLKALPNFDAQVFFEITGIDVRKPEAPQEIIVDGVTYVRKES